MQHLRKQFIYARRASLIAALSAFIAVGSSQAAEPAYKGKTLSDWLSELNTRPSGDDTQWEKWGPGNSFERKRRRDEDAIRQIGSNGIPTLLKILRITDENKGTALSKVESEKLKFEFRRRDARLDELRALAVEGFAILGTNAEPALPQLTKMLDEPDENIFEVVRAVNAIGPKGFAVLTNEFEKNISIRDPLIQAIGRNPDGDVTLILIRALNDPNAGTRGEAAHYLAGRDSKIAVPALIPLLDDTGYYPAQQAAIALGSFGQEAREAAPKLLSLYTNHVDPFVFQALKAIDPATAAKAERVIAGSGPLNPARAGYTKTLLKTGKELITGGSIHLEIPTVTNRPLASAELIDPATGKWSETGEMTTWRFGHTAILLNDGRVLVVGGSDSKDFDSRSAEIYDPLTGKWVGTGSLHAAHRAMQAVLQSDGKVRIPGGWDGSKMTKDESFNPQTERWSVITNK